MKWPNKQGDGTLLHISHHQMMLPGLKMGCIKLRCWGNPPPSNLVIAKAFVYSPQTDSKALLLKTPTVCQ